MSKQKESGQELIGENRQKILRIVSVIPVVVMMCIIFWFSAKPAHESEKSSTPIAKALLSVYESMHGTVDNANREDILSTLDFAVRKTAHVTEYFIFALCMGLALWTYGIRKRKFILINILSTIGYAATDEFHQLFVEGRAGRVSDVGIDSIGAILGTLLFYAISAAIVKKSRRSVR